MGQLRTLPALDSDEMATARKGELDIPREQASALGWSALGAIRAGSYTTQTGREVPWAHAIQASCAAKVSIPPSAGLPDPPHPPASETWVQVANETTLAVTRRLVQAGTRTLALNFANGLHPGGGFLRGARAQEEVLCRSSALFQTLTGDAMYEAHGRRTEPDSTDWAIYSPDVPVFRLDDGTPLEEPWLMNVLTCAAPYAPAVGQPRAGDLLQQRIHRILTIASAYGYSALVLGAWGCGAFGNDPHRTARDFRAALRDRDDTPFTEVVFAIADWSPERRTLGPFRDTFAQDSG